MFFIELCQRLNTLLRLKEEMMNDYDALRALPLVSVFSVLGVQSDWKARKGGSEFYGRCPFHQAKRNQTSFSFDSSGRFNCFSCGIKGRGAIDAVRLFKKVGFQDAVTILGGVRTQAPAVVTPSAPDLTENIPYKSSYEKFKVESSWLKERGVIQETLDHYGVFEYDNPKRKSAYSGKIMLPVRRYVDGEVVGYLARAKEGEPKYLFPKGVHKGLEVFGAWQLKASQPQRVVYLVESPFCVMAFHQLGLPAVSCYGWCVSPEQAVILSHLGKGYIYLPDRDKSADIGNSALLLSAKCWTRCPPLPEGVSDPEHLTRDQILALV